MELEKVAFYSSVALLSGFLIREIFKAKIKARTMAIKRSRLQELLEDESFKTLYFNPYFDDRNLERDRVYLVAYKKSHDGTGEIMPPETLEESGQETAMLKDRNYSAYRLSKEDIRKILDHFTDDNVVYILFKPVVYNANQEYLAYEVLAGDSLKKVTNLAGSVNVQNRMEGVSVMEGTRAETGIRTQTFALTSTRTFIMNPSPPATANMSY